MSGIGFEISCYSICVSLTGIVCLYTQLFLFWKYLQYKPVDRAITLSAVIEVPMAKMFLLSIKDQKPWRHVLSFVSVLFMPKIDTCFISKILLAKSWNLSSTRLDMFKDCIKLKLSIFDYYLLKPNLYSGTLMVDSIFSWLLDDSKKLFHCPQSHWVNRLCHMGSRAGWYNCIADRLCITFHYLAGWILPKSFQ